MKLLFFLLRQSRWIVVTSALAGVISGAANAALIAIVHDLVSGHSLQRSYLVAGFLALCIGLPLTRMISEILMAYLAQRAIFDLRQHMCQRILAVPLRHLEAVGTPRLLASLTDDIGSITNTLVQIPMIFIQVAVVAGCLVYMGWLSWPLVLAVLGFLVVGVLVWQLVVSKAAAFLRHARDQQDELFSHFRTITEGIKELKLHQRRRLAFMSELLQSTAKEYQRNNVIARSIYSGGGAFTQLLYFSAFGLLLLVLPQHMKVAPAVLTGFALVLLYLLTPLDFLMSIVVSFGRAAVALHQVEALGLALDEHAVDDAPLIEKLPITSWQRLDLAGVTHVYHREKENSTFSLGPIDLTFHAGEVVFITGGNGSGKTTLGKLITGLYLPEQGELRMDGIPIDAEAREQYRQLFSVVFSDFFLFGRLLGHEGREVDAKVREYLERLQLTQKVEVRQGELSTTELSQGQRKRLALLTAYMEDRPIYLFDEWAADQDPEFKKVFYYELLPELKARGKTIFVISHDDHYFHVADRVLKLADGKVDLFAPPALHDAAPLAPIALAGGL